MNISFSKSAIEDLESITEYYLEQGVPQIGQDFVKSIIEHPDIGRVVPEFNDELIREIIHSPFRVVYLRESKTINIIRVWRSERLLKLPNH
mgnify:CR=1 FL=1